MTRELDLIAWIRGRTPTTDGNQPGDDCATLELPGWGTLLVTTDSVIEGVHATWARDGADRFGYKAVARGLSDIAAMGGTPLWAVVAAGLPRDVTEKDARAVLEGAEATGCAIVGGDVAFCDAPHVNATVLGKAPATGPILRSGAQVGDRIYVSGPLGGSFASGRHLTFSPRVAEAQALLAACEVSAMIDLSDGLSSDLLHVLEASRVGCRVVAGELPCNGSVDAALNDGEDYELLAVVRTGEPPAPFKQIGEITAAEALLVHPGGSTSPLRRGGYEHGR